MWKWKLEGYKKCIGPMRPDISSISILWQDGQSNKIYIDLRAEEALEFAKDILNMLKLKYEIEDRELDNCNLK